jgi:membrane-bound ClpP family serine protease
MELLLDPNIAYLLLIAAVFFLLIAILSPGTGVPEVLALFAVLFAGYAVYRLSVNWWALGLLALSLVPFFFAAVHGASLAAVSIVGLTVTGLSRRRLERLWIRSWRW